MTKFIDTLKIDDFHNHDHDPGHSSGKNSDSKTTKIKKWHNKPSVIIVITLLLITGIIMVIYINNLQKENLTEDSQKQIIKKVRAITLDPDTENTAFVEAVGTVKAKTKIDVIALTGGTVKNLFFDVGDIVLANKVLASLSNNETSINLINAQTNFDNRQSNLAATIIITKENIRQAEIGVKTAEYSVGAIEITLKTAQDNLANAKTLSDKSNLDIKNNAIIAFSSYLNTADNALNQVDFILKVDGDEQLEEIASVLGVKNLNSVQAAKSNYRLAKDNYKPLESIHPDTDNITLYMADMVTALSLTKQAVDDTITVLDYTETNINFEAETLNTQKSNFIALRTSVINTQTGAESLFQTLSNLNLVQNQEITALENAVGAAASQLNIAQTNHINSLSSLEVIRENNELQIISAQTARDNARAQLNLAKAQAADLTIKAPIKGQITEKFVEIGTEVTSGQKIAELSQTDMVIIEIDLPVEDINKINSGQEARINPEINNLAGTVHQIYPAANPDSKKVKMEIIFNNKNKELIPESFVDVILPIENYTSSENGFFFIPLKAVTVTPKENFVFIAVDERAKKIPVKTGRTKGEGVEILSGLKRGDILVIEGGKDLMEDEEIEIVE